MIARGSLDSRGRPGSYSHETVPTALPIRLRLISRTALLVMIPIVLFFTTEGTWHLVKRHSEGGWSNHFFMAQADAIAHGRLNVARDEIRSECFDVGGRCYGYFGITPSVLRLPLFVKGRWFRSGLTPLYLGIAVLLAYWGALQLLVRSLHESSDLTTPRLTIAYAVAGALALGPGSTLLFVTRPAVYEEAIAWGVAFFMLTLGRVWVWYRTGSRRALVLAVIFAIAAANARPTAAPACAVLGLVVIALWWMRPARAPRAVLVAALCLALLPGLTASGVFWAKFHTPVPDIHLNEQVREAPWWHDILQRNGDRTFGPMFVPTALVAYLRPDAVTFRSAWPFVVFRFPKQPILWVPPLPPDGAYLNVPFTSATATMPFAWAVTLVVAIWLGVCGGRLRRDGLSAVWGVPMLTRLEWIFAAGSLASAAAMVGLVVSTVSIANRYLGDFYAVSAVGVALGPRVILPVLSRHPRLIAPLAAATVVFVTWSVFVSLALNYRLVFE